MTTSAHCESKKPSRVHQNLVEVHQYGEQENVAIEDAGSWVLAVVLYSEHRVENCWADGGGGGVEGKVKLIPPTLGSLKSEGS
jgi:hypothetical protein